MTSKQTAVIYIDANTGFFYSPGIGSVLQLDFPPDVISELDLVNKEKFEQILNLFIQNNFKGEFEIILVLSQNLTFEKELLPELGKDTETQIQEFIGVVPFEEVLSRAYKYKKNVKVVAMNKEIYDAIREVLVRNKLTISMTLPLSVLIETNPWLANKMDLGIIASKSDSFKQYNLIDYSPNSENVQKKDGGSKKSNTKLYALIGLFIALLLVLFIVVISTMKSNPKPASAPAVTPPITTPIPTIQNEINAVSETPTAFPISSNSAAVTPAPF